MANHRELLRDQSHDAQAAVRLVSDMLRYSEDRIRSEAERLADAGAIRRERGATPIARGRRAGTVGAASAIDAHDATARAARRRAGPWPPGIERAPSRSSWTRPGRRRRSSRPTCSAAARGVRRRRPTSAFERITHAIAAACRI
jgi:hypothetical protein